MVLSVIAATVVSTSAVDSAEAESVADLADTGAQEDIQDTGAITPVSLGDSFYARVKMIKYSDYYMTVTSAKAANPVLRVRNEYYTQVWQFTRDGSAYRIRSLVNNKYIEKNSSANTLCFASKNNTAAQKWYITKDATGYRLHSAVNDGYVMIGVSPAAATSRIELTNAVTNARAYFSFEKLSITADMLNTPVVKLSNQIDGVRVDWNDVKNATQYRVYRYNDSQKKWVALADVKQSDYTDTTAVSGTTYQYTVKTISPVLSKYEAKSIEFIAAPQPKVNNTVNGPQIYWSKVAGAEKYRVFYHNGTKWKIIADTTETSLLHTKFEYNKVYKYTVRCVTADSKTFTSAYLTDGVSNTIVQAPEVKASVMPFTIDLSWNKVTGASKYRLFYKSKSTDWKWTKIGDTAALSYSFSNVVSNNGYYFTARAVDESGNLISGFRSTKLINFYDAPCIFDITSTSNTKKISWYPVDGAEQYRIFVWNGQKWKIKADVPSYTTSYSVSVSGTEEQNLCYTVRCMDKNGKFISSLLETVLESDLRYYYPGEYTSAHKF